MVHKIYENAITYPLYEAKQGLMCLLTLNHLL